MLHLINMKGFNFSTVAKVFCDSFHLNIGKSGGFIGLKSGQNIHAFVVPLPLLKALHKHLGARLEEYEKQHGEIDDSQISLGIQSPVQKDKS